MTWAVVVPSNRPDRLAEFKAAWAELFEAHDVNLIVVRDEPSTWATLPWWVPTRTDMIRSWGFVQAWESGVDYVLTLDDDVRPVPDVDPFLEYEDVFEQGAPCSPYLSVGGLSSSAWQMRGFPYTDRAHAPVAVQYGGWDGVLDYDAVTQLAGSPGDAEMFLPVVLPVPRWVPVTTCIMNCAFRRDVTPIMWQLPLVEGRYNRWGDIWSGLLQKRALDAVGEVMVVNGAAVVHHERASDPLTNLRREMPGIDINEDLWARLLAPTLELSLVAAWMAYTEAFASVVRRHGDDVYADVFLRARDAWLEALGVTA